MNSTEQHELLLAEGWTTRVDGLMRPPAHWPDQAARTPAAAWHDHTEQDARDNDGRADRG